MPYRSLVLSFPDHDASLSGSTPVDVPSLELIERAQGRYAAAAGRAPVPLEGRALRDCAFVDVELLRATIESLNCSIASLSTPHWRPPVSEPARLPHEKEM